VKFFHYPSIPSENFGKESNQAESKISYCFLSLKQSYWFRNQYGSVAYRENLKTYAKLSPVEEAGVFSSVLLSPITLKMQSFSSCNQTSPLLHNFYFLKWI